jgi:hypothetical protein
MAGDPRVLGLLEEMLDAGKTPDEVCRGCPDLLAEVREKWKEFRRIDAAVVECSRAFGRPRMSTRSRQCPRRRPAAGARVRTVR